jgi:hypothetical protein
MKRREFVTILVGTVAWPDSTNAFGGSALRAVHEKRN